MFVSRGIRGEHDPKYGQQKLIAQYSQESSKRWLGFVGEDKKRQGDDGDAYLEGSPGKPLLRQAYGAICQ